MVQEDNGQNPDDRFNLPVDYNSNKGKSLKNVSIVLIIISLFAFAVSLFLEKY